MRDWSKMGILIVLLVIGLIGSVTNLDLHNVHIPPFKLLGEDVEMECKFSLDPGEQLYAVKWYKDHQEIYRFIPRFNPSIFSHYVEGVQIDKRRSGAQKITLRSVSLLSTGIYRCEVSAEAPSFASNHGEGSLQILYLPMTLPAILTNVNKAKFEIGEFLELNCTSAQSYPKARISFFINGKSVKELEDSDGEIEIPQISSEIIPNSSQMQNIPEISSITQNLRIKLSDKHFDLDGKCKISCFSRIFVNTYSHQHFSPHYHQQQQQNKKYQNYQNVRFNTDTVIVFDTKESYVLLERSSGSTLLKTKPVARQITFFILILIRLTC